MLPTPQQGIKLIDFFPGYSGIHVPRDDPLYTLYPLPKDKYPKIDNEFYITTFLKKEFNDLKLTAISPEIVPGKGFQPLNHQLFVSRFLSQYTPYDKMVVFHSVGSGKSCLASLLAETSKMISPDMNPALFLVRNEALQRNISNEIATTCTNNKYKPSLTDSKTGKKINQDTYNRRLNANIRTNYDIETFERFAKELEANKDDQSYIKDVFSNRIIIVDEAHNLRLKPTKMNEQGEEKLSIYNEIHRFLHTVENCKIILMTATPMRDRPDEIASLFNLLLPLDKQFNKDKFIVDFFNERGPSKYDFKESERDSFKNKIKGLVSYVGETSSNVKKIQEGIVVNGLQKMKLSVAEMSNFQTKIYNSAYRNDTGVISEADDDEEADDSVGGLYKNSRQANLFVAGDGSFGSDLMENGWIEDSNNPKVTQKLKDLLGGNDISNDDRLILLTKYASKYAETIRQLILYPKEKAFIYSNLVSGSGAVMFAALLELFGFVPVALPEKDRSEDEVKDDGKKKGKKKGKTEGIVEDIETYRAGPRKFLLITGKYPTSAQSSFLVNKVYNDPKNLYGDYISVIVASKIVSEGISFKHTRQFHCLTPGWNETELSQAQGRVVRAFAHDVFPDNQRYIKIFRWCALPDDNEPSIDLYMYKISEDKDYPIKQIERLLKETAVDCALNSGRNMRSDIYEDNSRECDYSTCSYKCDDIPEKWYNTSENIKDGLIEDSYNLYYAREQIEIIKREIINMFRYKFMYDFFEMMSLLPKYTDVIIIRALKDIIDYSIPIVNKYGLISYLRENSNLYFLIDVPELQNIANFYLLSIYTSNPPLKTEMSFENYVDYFKYDKGYICDKIKMLSDFDNINNMGDNYMEIIKDSMINFDLYTQEYILESILITKDYKYDTFKNILLKIYEYAIFIYKDLIVSNLLEKNYKVLRCYDTVSWNNCSPDQQSVHIQNIKPKQSKRKDKALIYEHEGVIVGDKFKIRVLKVEKSARKVSDKRTIPTGLECGKGKFSAGTLKFLLLYLGEIAEKVGDSPPDVEITDQKTLSQLDNKTDEQKREYIRNHIKKSKDNFYLNALNITDAYINNLPTDKLLRWYIILNNGTANNLCLTLKEWFNSIGCLEYERKI
jgi:superfamily II DNA or RNA helicase